MSSGVLNAPVGFLEIRQDASGESVCRVMTEDDLMGGASDSDEDETTTYIAPFEVL